MTDEELAILERVACPSAGACGGQFTANTMACVSEAVGLALMNSSGAPAPYESRDQYGVASGEAVMNLIEKNIRARDIVTRKSLETAARVVAGTGGSTNAGLHLPAIAHEAGIDFDLSDVCEICRDTPYFVDLKPRGQYVAKDLYEAGGVPVVMKELRKAGLMHEDCMTASGRTMGEELDLIKGAYFQWFWLFNRFVYAVSVFVAFATRFRDERCSHQCFCRTNLLGRITFSLSCYSGGCGRCCAWRCLSDIPSCAQPY